MAGGFKVGRCSPGSPATPWVRERGRSFVLREAARPHAAARVVNPAGLPLCFPGTAALHLCVRPRPQAGPNPDPQRPMPVKSDRWIRRMALEHGMIEPFESGQVRNGSISYGLSSFGYDIRVAPEFKVFTNVHNLVVDPKAFDERSFVDVKDRDCIIPPNSFALARTVEYFRVPRDVLVLCVGKSTYARCGIIVNVTPLEPTWEGFLTLEISNTTPLPAKIYGNEGIAQLVFFQGDEAPEVAYKDRKGKYQGQVGVTLPKL